MNVEQLNGASLALVGDAYYDLYIRIHLLEKGLTNPKQLHDTAVRYVSASAHHKIVHQLMDMWTQEEIAIFKRGRNYKYSIRKNVDIAEYVDSSGFEALIGYLFLKKDEKRLKEILEKSIQVVEGDVQNA